MATHFMSISGSNILRFFLMFFRLFLDSRGFIFLQNPFGLALKFNVEEI